MARLPAVAAWAAVRYDPGAVLLIVRGGAAILASPSENHFPSVLREPAILELALRHLSEATSFPAGMRPCKSSLHETGIRYARLAQKLAEKTGRCHPDNAWVAGLLAPLGWYALAAVDPDAPATPDWDGAAIARRLLHQWKVPSWIAAVAGRLGLPLEVAQGFGADTDIFRIAQAAILLVNKQCKGVGISVGSTLAANLAALELTAEEADALAAAGCGEIDTVAPGNCTSPEIAYLPDLIRLAAENLRLRDAPKHDEILRENDRLHAALERQHAGEAERLHELKLGALAEFAAGAAHEINNPMAVISGQAQYLLGFETDAAHQRALQTIIAQTQRVDQLLSELIQFARPARPQKQLLDLAGLVREVVLALTDLALQRQVRLVCPEPDPTLSIHGDPKHIRIALECLLRNAIEAAPLGGWAGLRLETAGPGRAEWIVEDSGSGPSADCLDHLFDPFFSGREAGRGHGLGLPTAWRLARENGGDLHYDPDARPTRFVLTLPTEPGSNGHTSAVKSASLSWSKPNGSR
jgi:signal transduction histidine kinase